MRVVHVLRKPLSEGTVAANTLKHGCGGLHIAVSRISTGDTLDGGAYAENPTHRAGEDMWTRDRKGDTNCFKRGGAGHYEQPAGRWPGNLILQHLDGCRCVGAKKVKGNRTDTRPDGDGGREDKSQWRFRPTDQTKRGFSDDDGKETVAHWICEPGCPVARLDEDTVLLKVGGNRGPSMSSKVADVYGKLNAMSCGTEYNHDTDSAGGASRFFKQIGGNTDG